MKRNERDRKTWEIPLIKIILSVSNQSLDAACKRSNSIKMDASVSTRLKSSHSLARPYAYINDTVQHHAKPNIQSNYLSSTSKFSDDFELRSVENYKSQKLHLHKFT